MSGNGENGNPAYDPDRHCPKCDYAEVFTSYEADSHGYECWGHEVPQPYDPTDRRACSRCGDEHFHRCCRRCHHKWREELTKPLIPDPVLRVLGRDALYCADCKGWHHVEYHDGRPTRADLIASYEMKVQDFAAETMRSSAWRDACRWAVRALSDRERSFVLNGEGWAPPDMEPLLAEALEAGLPDKGDSGGIGGDK